MNTKTQDGFTLIELLVVISIISLLSSVVLASLQDAREQARDSQRIQEMRSLQTALELYKSREGEYPPSSGWNHGCPPSQDGFSNTLDPLVQSGFIPEIPRDPLWPDTGSAQCYYYKAPSSDNGCNANSGGETVGYMLRFSVEAEDGSGNSPYNFPEWTDDNRSDHCLVP